MALQLTGYSPRPWQFSTGWVLGTVTTKAAQRALSDKDTRVVVRDANTRQDVLLPPSRTFPSVAASQFEEKVMGRIAKYLKDRFPTVDLFTMRLTLGYLDFFRMFCVIAAAVSKENTQGVYQSVAWSTPQDFERNVRKAYVRHMKQPPNCFDEMHAYVALDPYSKMCVADSMPVQFTKDRRCGTTEKWKPAPFRPPKQTTSSSGSTGDQALDAKLAALDQGVYDAAYAQAFARYLPTVPSTAPRKP